MSTKTKKNSSLLFAAVVLFSIVVLSRIVGIFYSITATDIMYADWVPSILNYVTEFLGAFYVAAAYCLIVYSIYNGRLKGAVITVLSVTLVDFSARFMIDLINGSIAGMERFAFIWLVLQLVYELVFMALSFIIGRMMYTKYLQTAGKVSSSRFSSDRAVMYSVLLYMASRLFSEILYLIDFLTTYTNITNTEIASIVGSFMTILVVYGAAALVFASVFGASLKKRIVQNNT